MEKANSSLTIAVIGCGSIGLRHLQNLQDFGVKHIIACDADKARLNNIRHRFKGITLTDDYKHMLKDIKVIDAALVALPTHLHIPVALACAKRGIHLFIEKPLSHSRAGVNSLINTVTKRGIIAMMAMCYRFHPIYKRIKRVVEEGSLGKIYSVDITSGHHLSSWHPKGDYRKEYSARKDMGGGVILTSGIHSFDTIRWIFGEVTVRSCIAGKISNLEIDVEDTMECLMQGKYKAVIRLHLDFLRKEKNHRISIAGEKGIIEADIISQTIRTWLVGGKGWEEEIDSSPLNTMYAEEMRYFLTCLVKKNKPFVDIEEGKKSLMLTLEAKKNARL